MEVKELQKRVEELEEARNRIRPQWEEIARYVTPGRGVFDDAEPNQGDRKDRDLLDATPFQALTTLAAQEFLDTVPDAKTKELLVRDYSDRKSVV